jgi:uracil-DNA glycosylase
MQVPDSWQSILIDETSAPYFRELSAFVKDEREKRAVFPPAHEVFRALELTPFEDVKVVLLGQDPYHDEGQAHGLCFSVRSPTKPPPSLKNVFRELRDDLGVIVPEGRGDLEPWARQGVLLLNTVLTVVAHEPASHKKRGWERFTDAIVKKVAARDRPAVFCLWGAHARAKADLVDSARHVVIESAHPSPLSVKKFLGTRPFSKIDTALARLGYPPIDWSLSR